jgi:SAM-dependent methyltransferase
LNEDDVEATMTEQAIRSEVHRLAPFHHDVELPHGLRTHVPERSNRELERTRLPNLVKHLWPSMLEVCGGSLRRQRVLDVACNCGGFSVQAAKSGADYVLGIDIVDRYLEQADFLRRVLDLRQVEFKKLGIEDLDASHVGHFDVTFCFGVLYHLENPILAMKRLSAVTRRLVAVDTTVTPPGSQRDPIWVMNFPPAANARAKDATSLWRPKGACQFTPNAPAVIELLRFLGFRDVRQLEPAADGLEKRYYDRTRVTFIGIR